MLDQLEENQNQSLTRNILRIISKNSNLTEKELKNEFRINEIYANQKVWSRTVNVSLIGIGAAFLVAGIIFFLAFNWHIIPKMIKLGSVQVLVVALVVTSFFFKRNPLVKNVLMMCASFLVGAMFSVFGQIYQTGADAYDFFLGWTTFVLIWTLVSYFPPLWLLTVALVNITISCYIDQVAHYWAGDLKYLILFSFNSIVLIIFQLMPKFIKDHVAPSWLVKIVSLSIAIYITIGATSLIFNKYVAHWPIFFLLATAIYAIGVYQSFKNKSLFNLCIIPLSIIIILCMLITHYMQDDSGMLFFFLSIFVIACITVLVKFLSNLNKAWHE